MRSSSIGFSDFFPFRTSDRHLEFASRRCLRGDRPRSATRIDRRILLKKDLLAFGRASIDAANSSAGFDEQSASSDRKTRSCAGASGLLTAFALRLCKLPAPALRSESEAFERLVIAFYCNCTSARSPVSLIAQSDELYRARGASRGHLVESSCVMPPKRRLASETLGRLAIAQAGMHRDKSGADPR